VPSVLCVGVTVHVFQSGLMHVLMGVLGHGQLLVRNMLWLAVVHGFGDADDSVTAFSPVPSR
jgi:hypothetical protein